MRTNFTPEQLQNPRLAEADAILRKCVHCGFCTATCPTYVLLGDERDSPRGRIYLMKEMFETGARPSGEVMTHIDRCLSCLSCMTTCPSGVDYMHLVDMARARIEESGQRTYKERLLRRVLGAVLPYPARFRAALWLAKLGRPFAGLLRKLRLKEAAAMLALAPRRLPKRGTYGAPGVIEAEGRRRKRVALLTGCAQTQLRPEINDATVRLLTRHGVEVVIAAGQGCCGALVQHMGLEGAAARFARANVAAWMDAMRAGPLDAIIVNASGCGTTVKDYGHLLQHDAAHAEPAKALASLAKDIAEFVHEIGLMPPDHWTDLKVAYHSACSMQHGQRIEGPPRELLRQAGYSVVEVPEGHLCCGSAGTYNILQPDLAAELKARKLANIASVEPDAVATGNIGCIAQLAGAGVPVVHTVELLDWATGGPCPRGLEPFAERVRSVRALVETQAA